MARFAPKCFLFLILLAGFRPAFGQATTYFESDVSLPQTAQVPYAVARPLLEKEWAASWICVPHAPQNEFGVYLFRKEFDASPVPKKLVVHVSADNRYKLYINGHWISMGPSRSDVFHWAFESVDIAPFLKSGRNCLSAIVWNEGEARAQAQFSYRTGFILQSEEPAVQSINTSDSWECVTDSSRKSYTPYRPGFQYITGPAESVDFNLAHTGWQLSSGGQHWAGALPFLPGAPKGIIDWSDAWMLVPRAIPMEELKIQRFAHIISGERKLSAANPLHFSIPANSRLTILLDQGFLGNAFFNAIFSGGKNAGISVSYAETLFEPYEDKGRVRLKKANRNQTQGMVFSGKSDTLVLSGAGRQEFSSLSYRTYRYVQLDIQTKNQAVEISDLFGIACGYPFKLNASFKADDSSLEKIFETGWRTARACAVETYMDCPYYEQLQYIGDTRIQALVSLFNSGDDRLMRNALRQFDNSRIPEGITQSRFPGVHQLIPPFSLYWIAMVHDFYRYRKDDGFIRSMLNGTRQVLGFFKSYQGKDHLLAHVPYWNFTDWPVSKGWDRGVAPVDSLGHSSILDLQLLMAYEYAAEIEHALGDPVTGREYAAQVSLMKKSIRMSYYDRPRGLFSDNLAHDTYSQHAGALAILAGVTTGAEAKLIARKLRNDHTLTPATIYFRFYLNTALLKALPEANYSSLLDDWRKQLSYGLSTWAEVSDPVNTRSDCHAWGASPNIELIRELGGIDSDSSGFSRIRIAPRPGELLHFQVSMPHPAGLITLVGVKKQGHWTFNISTPKGIPCRFVWEGKSVSLVPAANNTLHF